MRVQWLNLKGRYDSDMGLRGAEYIRTHVPSFDLVASHYSTAPLFVRFGDAAREVQGAAVSSQYFPLLGVTPRLGRFFSAAEDSVPDRDPVAVISDALWQSQYAGATDVVGASLTINRPTYRGLAQLLAAIAVILLAVACANVGGLLLARGIARQREIVMRAALGASRARLVRQLLTENLLLALVGGALGTLLSTWATSRLMGFFLTDDEGYSRQFNLSLDFRVLAFAVGVSIVTVLLFGLLPSIIASRSELTTVLKGAGKFGDRSRVRMALVSAQVALSMVLLIGAGLLVRSSVNVLHWNSFDPMGVTLLRVRPRLASYTPAKAQAFLRRAVSQLQQLPEVEGVAYARGVGFVWQATDQIPVSRPSDAPRSPKDRELIDYHEVSPGFFATLRVPLLAGREFTEADSAGMPRVAVITAQLAKRLWPQGQALDQTMRLDSSDFRVVGIVKDYRFGNEGVVGGAPPAMAFVPFWQNAFGPQDDARLAVRVRGDPSAAIPVLRRAISAADPDVPVTETLAMRTQVLASFNQVRLGSAILVTASLLALFLSAIGLYGVMSFIVARGTREIGIRLAVGARAGQVMGDFLRRAGDATLIGGVIGVAVALGAGRLLSSWLVGVAPTDALSFVVAALAVGGVALIASVVPARRAARIDPAVAMRSE